MLDLCTVYTTCVHMWTGSECTQVYTWSTPRERGLLTRVPSEYSLDAAENKRTDEDGRRRQSTARSWWPGQVGDAPVGPAQSQRGQRGHSRDSRELTFGAAHMHHAASQACARSWVICEGADPGHEPDSRVHRKRAVVVIDRRHYSLFRVHLLVGVKKSCLKCSPIDIKVLSNF